MRKHLLPAVVLAALISTSVLSSAAHAQEFSFGKPSFEAGKAAYHEKRWMQAIQNLRPLAEAGDDRAMLLLGNMYNDGKGVIRNTPEAFALYRRAAVEKNNIPAMIQVGTILNMGIGGVPADVPLARAWFKRAANLGSQLAAYYYGIMCFQGNAKATPPIAPDAQEAYKWFLLASRWEPQPGMPNVKKLAAAMARGTINHATKAQIDAGQKAADAWIISTPEQLGAPPDEVKEPEAKAPNDSPTGEKKAEAPKNAPAPVVPEKK